ncbi:hypothetical protein FLJU110815_19725 [Flavobacterium jumunjinense]
MCYSMKPLNSRVINMKKYFVCFLLIQLFGCKNENNCEQDLKKANEEIIALKKRILETKTVDSVFSVVDTLPKNYLINNSGQKKSFKPNMIELKNAEIIYKGENDNLAWLHLEVTNTLSRDIKSIMIKIHSVDCDNSDDEYIEEFTVIRQNATKTIEIQISSQIIHDKIMNCYKHPPVIEITDAILITGERYPNTKGRNYYKYEGQSN